MKITREVVTYITKDFYHTQPWAMNFGQFKSIRENRKLAQKQFSLCFSCGHKFRDEDAIFIALSHQGNVFLCEECYNKHKDEINQNISI